LIGLPYVAVKRTTAEVPHNHYNKRFFQQYINYKKMLYETQTTKSTIICSVWNEYQTDETVEMMPQYIISFQFIVAEINLKKTYLHNTWYCITENRQDKQFSKLFTMQWDTKVTWILNQLKNLWCRYIWHNGKFINMKIT